jgi:CheY-like chemotaxis protein
VPCNDPEDDPDTRLLLNRLLLGAGCRTIIVTNGQEGLEALENEKPDLILLDLMMPEMDGFEFLERIRGEENWREIPVIVTTAKELDDSDRERLSGEVERVMQKGNYSRDELVREICDVIARVGPLIEEKDS